MQSVCSRRRKSTPSPEPDVMDYEEMEEEEVEEEEEEQEEEPTEKGGIVMNEHMAAMVLTTLSCSPVSPSFPPHITEKATLLKVIIIVYIS